MVLLISKPNTIIILYLNSETYTCAVNTDQNITVCYYYLPTCKEKKTKNFRFYQKYHLYGKKYFIITFWYKHISIFHITYLQMTENLHTIKLVLP